MSRPLPIDPQSRMPRWTLARWTPARAADVSTTCSVLSAPASCSRRASARSRLRLQRAVSVATTGHVKLHAALRIPHHSALVLLMEGSAGRFPARPARFLLPRHLGNLGGCCEIPTGPGAELLFRDRGRKFYALVYIGQRAPATARREIVRLLTSLRVSALG